MPSSFKSKNLFGSGPHEFAIAKQGQVVVSNLTLGGTDPSSTPIGPREIDITVSGRLVAASESALWTLRDALTAELLTPPTAGTLADGRGRSWSGMSFIAYEESGSSRVGRVWSVGYVATFRRFATVP
ncbi:MAG: hypothetical protein SFY96_11205 [Planctomycetota bacterium]|nr:hypothetical protein [Planctomycetota bacterium]